MASIEEREKNLFNATDAMAQFYEEIENFLGILTDYMGNEGYSIKGVRLRSGTFTLKNLTRRLLANIFVMYLTDIADGEDVDEPVDEEDEEDEKVESKALIPISQDLVAPFASVWLYPPKVIPSVRILSSPMLLIGSIGKFTLVDKKTNQKPDPYPTNPEIALSNLAQISIPHNGTVGKPVSIRCWKPKELKRYLLRAELLSFERIRLLEIDSQEKVQGIANRLLGFCKA